MDVTDVYQERIVADPNSPSGLSTLYNGKLEPVQALPQTFRANTIGDGVLDSLTPCHRAGPIPAAVLIVPRRNEGPIISLNQAAGTAISVQYAGFSGTREVQAFRGINRATNLNQFIRALQNFDVGSQKFIYADTSGNIAYFTSGEVPLREDLQAGAVERPASVSDPQRRGWQRVAPRTGATIRNRALPYAILPFSEMPQAGQSAARDHRQFQQRPHGNNRDNNVLNMLRPDGGIRYMGWDTASTSAFAPGASSALFAPFLASGQKLGMADLQRIQADVVMGDAQYFTPFIVQALANAQRPCTGRAGRPRCRCARGRGRGPLRCLGSLHPHGHPRGLRCQRSNGMRAQPRQGEIDNSIAATIYSVFRNQLVNQALVATLSRRGAPVHQFA